MVFKSSTRSARRALCRGVSSSCTPVASCAGAGTGAARRSPSSTSSSLLLLRPRRSRPPSRDLLRLKRCLPGLHTQHGQLFVWGPDQAPECPGTQLAVPEALPVLVLPTECLEVHSLERDGPQVAGRCVWRANSLHAAPRQRADLACSTCVQTAELLVHTCPCSDALLF